MYLSDIASEGLYSPSRPAGNLPGSTHDVDSMSGGARRSSHIYHTTPAAPPTSISLDDNFDAFTTEVPTEWAAGDGHPDYDESVSGYRNYVTELERMLSGQMENASRAEERQHHQYQVLQQQQTRSRTLRRSEISVSESARGSSKKGAGEGRLGGRIGVGGSQQLPLSPLGQPSPMSPPPENARKVSGRKAYTELVEQRILEDTPSRTISLWRERVAQSSVGVSTCADDLRSEAADSHMRAPGHRRAPSGSVNGDGRCGLRRVVSEYAPYTSSIDGGGTRNESVRGTANGKPARAERSEYMVSYQHDPKNGISKGSLPPRSEDSNAALSRDMKTPSSPTLSKVYDRAPSPKLRRHLHRKSLDRNERMYTYPQTPPHTGSQASSSNPNENKKLRPSVHSFHEIVEENSMLKATSTSSVEIILSSCDPSLLHIAPILDDLGIKRVDHLRAIARLSNETRDREVKEQALKRGVTVVEWAIFLDKLQSL